MTSAEMSHSGPGTLAVCHIHGVSLQRCEFLSFATKLFSQARSCCELRFALNLLCSQAGLQLNDPSALASFVLGCGEQELGGTGVNGDGAHIES